MIYHLETGLLRAPEDTTTTVESSTTTTMVPVQGARETWYTGSAFGAGGVCGFILLLTMLLRSDRGR